MISADFTKKQGMWIGFEISGHAGFADAGRDVVCASVSSAAMLTVNMITENFGYHANVSAVNDTVKFLAKDMNETVSRIISAFEHHLRMISLEFPKAININISEV